MKLKKKTKSLINGTDLSGWRIDIPDMDNNPDAANPYHPRWHSYFGRTFGTYYNR